MNWVIVHDEHGDGRALLADTAPPHNGVVGTMFPTLDEAQAAAQAKGVEAEVLVLRPPSQRKTWAEVAAS